MNIRIHIILLSIIFLGCNEISKPIAKGMVSTENKLFEVNKNDVELRPNEGLVYYNDQPFTGRVISKYTNRTTAEIIDYQSGRRGGYHRKWFSNGIQSFEARWIDGMIDGVSKSWWRNGNQRSEANQVNGKLHGVQLQWYTSGADFKERNMNMGIEEGIQRSWRENGKIYNNYEAKNGRIFGLKRASLCFQLDDEEIKINY